MGDLAERFRDLRVQKGLTSTALARPRYSVSYVSQIERGLRRPSAEALRFFAGRLGVSADHLETGIPDDAPLRLRYELETAERELAQGEAEEAERRVREVLAEAERYGMDRLQGRAWLQLGATLHRRDRTAEAIDAYEAALGFDLGPGHAGLALSGLARAYRAMGDLRYATELVETFLAGDLEVPLPSVVATDLYATLVGLYFDRGDLSRAERAAERALAAADAEMPAEIRAEAFWAASRVLAERRCWEEALDLANRARVLLDGVHDRRRVAGLHTSSARLCLEVDPPGLEDAGRHLDAAERLLEGTVAPAELAALHAERGRLYLLRGRPEVALRHGERSAAVEGAGDLERARALTLQGRALAALDRGFEARAAFEEAALAFEKLGARREQASCWREIGELDASGGDYAGAFDALRAGLEAVAPRRPSG